MVPKFYIVTPKNRINFCLDASDTVWKASPRFPWMENMSFPTVLEMCKKKGWQLFDEFNCPC
jgi:hypothetical protein